MFGEQCKGQLLSQPGPEDRLWSEWQQGTIEGTCLGRWTPERKGCWGTMGWVTWKREARYESHFKLLLSVVRPIGSTSLWCLLEMQTLGPDPDPLNQSQYFKKIPASPVHPLRLQKHCSGEICGLPHTEQLKWPWQMSDLSRVCSLSCQNAFSKSSFWCPLCWGEKMVFQTVFLEIQSQKCYFMGVLKLLRTINHWCK